MTPALQFMLALALLIGSAKLGGYISQHFNQPSVLGELLIGVLLGPTFLNLLHLPLFPDEHLPTLLHEVAEVGVVLLMFFAGLEIHLDGLLRSGRVALSAGVMGVIVPLVLGTVGALPFGYELRPALFIGVILTATSVSISAQTLMELNVLRTRPGLALLGAAVVDDVLGILVLSIFVALAGSAAAGPVGPLALLWVLLRMALFLAAALYFGFWLLPLGARWASRLPVSEGLLAYAIVVAFLFAILSEALGGVAAITGSFIAGVALSRSESREQIEEKMHALAYGFFVPIFFVSIGLLANARLITPERLPFVALIVLIAILSKIIGCGLGGWIGGFSPREALQLGTGMISRGEVGLIVATVGITTGIIGQEIFAMAVIVVLVTTLVTPPMLRVAFRQREAHDVERTVPGAG